MMVNIYSRHGISINPKTIVSCSYRPAPQGHEDLAEPWVGAGDLKVGDKVRQADGTTGTVRIVRTEQKIQTMYNLDVANLDNFFVGEQGWLLHNADPCLLPAHLYNAGGDAGMRALKELELDKWLQNGLKVGDESFTLKIHAYNSLFKSGRKDIMPVDIIDALATKNPLAANVGSVKYVNPVTGTQVFVNPTTNAITGVWPAGWK
jgi:hypothetical protein